MKSLATICLLAITSCSTFYNPDGKIRARIMGDYTYQRTKDGAETITLKHSPVIRAGGIATAQVIGAAGTAASAALLIK